MALWASPAFPTSVLCYFAFTKKLALVLVSLTERYLKTIIAFTKKGKKMKIALSVRFTAIPIGAVLIMSSESGTTRLLPGNHTQHLGIKPPVL